MSDIHISADNARRIAQYVATTDVLLTKQSALDAAIDAVLPQALDVLISRGVLQADARSVKLAEFKSNPAAVIAQMTKLANVMPALGSPDARQAAKSKKSEADVAYESALTE